MRCYCRKRAHFGFGLRDAARRIDIGHLCGIAAHVMLCDCCCYSHGTCMSRKVVASWVPTVHGVGPVHQRNKSSAPPVCPKGPRCWQWLLPRLHNRREKDDGGMTSTMALGGVRRAPPLYLPANHQWRGRFSSRAAHWAQALSPSSHK